MSQYEDLINELNSYQKAYDEGKPIISDRDWDAKFYQLQDLEREQGFTSPLSPTQRIVFETVSKLNKVEHDHPMLSLAKTKDVKEVEKFFDNDHEWIAMPKLDGLTCSLTYQDGFLVQAETRGNGYVGEDILHNIRVMAQVPKCIPFPRKVVIDGEIICRYSDFERFEGEYKNPRNFAAGSIRLLDSRECLKRRLSFIAWDVIEGIDRQCLQDKLTTLQINTNMEVVPVYSNAAPNCEQAINVIKKWAQASSLPIDGVVFKYDDVEYGKTLGNTAHHFNNAIAYKFFDEESETELLDINWTMGRTGVLTPVAVFAPVEIDGTTVTRASLHNYSVMKETLGHWPYKNEKIRVIKSNMIIPQITWAEKYSEDNHNAYDFIELPTKCPVCGEEEIQILDRNGVQTVICNNPKCEGKIINQFEHFCGKKGLDIKGLSNATLEKLIDWGWLDTVVDIPFLGEEHRDEWIKKPGFGIASVDKILSSIETALYPAPLWRVISAAGIPLIGETYAKTLAKYFKSYKAFREAVDSGFDFSLLDGFGDNMCLSIRDYEYTFLDNFVRNIVCADDDEVGSTTSTFAAGQTFCITGKVHLWKNRDEIKAYIEAAGGKVTGSVSSKTNYLICNDKTSGTQKVVQATKLNVPVLTEEELKELVENI